MTEDFVSFDIAYKLEEKGYPIKYQRDGVLGLTEVTQVIVPPTIAQVLKWMRENKKLHVSIMTFMFRAGWCYEVVRLGENPNLVAAHRNSYNTYEKAAIAGIEYVLNNLI